MEIELVHTADGSDTLYVKSLDEHYHSTHGALQESVHVFVNAGLANSKSDPIALFEVGFGTGLNAILAYRYAVAHQIRVCYHGIEKYPLAAAVIAHLNYASFLSAGEQQVFEQLHSVAWNCSHEIGPYFEFRKTDADLLLYEPSEKYNLIFMDAFSPNKQAEMWADSVFEKLASITTSGGELVTYTAKGDVKRSLRKAGFRVKRLVGPPGKRNMIRATKL
ncbi:MAG: tRNA 5-methylaminomethyl-2-thiouridine biosynthesis bifunctional protein MnmC [Bacteroidota bacterium]|jgi:tRNA U34 5-methylaminomethyl-2-thiouridine-forming methyltransferase MnmC